MSDNVPGYVNSNRRDLDAVLRRDFAAFCEAFFHVATGEQFSPNWHIDAMAYQLERCLKGKRKRLVVALPPRSLKSYCISVAFPAWALGHDPSLKIMCVSYSQDLANEHAQATRKIMQSALYRRLFPHTVLTKSRPPVHNLETTAGGRRIADSVSGGITGWGANIIILDDPMRADDVYSEAGRHHAKRFYSNTLVTRLNSQKEGKIILVMQRLHVDDLAAHVLKDSRYKLLRIPAIAREDLTYRLKNGRKLFKAGKILDPKRDTRSNLDALARSMGTARFEAQFQQNPVPEDGDLVKRSWFRRWDSDPDMEWDFVIQSWDTATSNAANSAYSVCLTFGMRGQCYYLLDLYRERLDITQLKREVIRLRKKFKADRVLVELASSGISIFQIFPDLSEHEGIPPVFGCRPRRSKLDRLMREIDLIEDGRIYLPKADFVEHYLEELTLFPGGPYDDCVDATTQFLHHVRNRQFGKGRFKRRRASRKSNPNGAAARLGRLQNSLGPRRSPLGYRLSDLFRGR